MTLTVAFASKSKRRHASSGISINTVHMCITSIKLKSGWQSKFSGNTVHVYLGFAIVYCKNRPYLFIKTLLFRKVETTSISFLAGRGKEERFGWRKDMRRISGPNEMQIST